MDDKNKLPPLENSGTIVLNAEEYNRFLEMVNAPARPIGQKLRDAADRLDREGFDVRR